MPDSHARRYAGVGSRKLPAWAYAYLKQLAIELGRRGYAASTGDADGSDAAIFEGCIEAGTPVTVYAGRGKASRPEGIRFASFTPEQQARSLALAKQFHPNWTALSEDGRWLMARNGFQVLGPDLDAPVNALFCYAPGSRFEGDRLASVSGGTGQAVRLAYAHDIPAYNIALSDHRTVIEQRLGAPIAAALGLDIAEQAPLF